MVAVIVGSNGQDGQLLTKKLSSLGYEVIGLRKESIDITSPDSVNKLISDTQPDEIYFLAAYHHSSEDAPEEGGDLFRKSINIHTVSAVNFLDAIAYRSSKSRFFYASSCLIFPPMESGVQTEDTLLSPENAYAITKIAGMMACRHYRDTKGVFASIGILYNHESPLRSKKFISRKIVSAAVQIAREKVGSLLVGNLEAKVDWGYAPDYVDAMHKILLLPKSSDYVIATGETHSVREFVEIAFEHVGLDYKQYVKTNSQILTRSNLTRIGDPSRLINDTGWNHTLSFKEMVKTLVDAEIKACG